MAIIKGERPGVTLSVRDVKQAAQWYNRQLGLEIGPTDGRNFAEMFAEEKYVFHLCLAPNAVPLDTPVFSLQSGDIERTHHALASAGVDVTPIQWNSDNAGFYFRDGEGNAVGVGQFFTHRVTQLAETRIAAIEVERDNWPAILAKLERLIPVEPSERVVLVRDNRSEDALYAGFPFTEQREIPEELSIITIPAGNYGIKWHYGKIEESDATFAVLDGLLAGEGQKVGGLRLAFQSRPANEEHTEADLYVLVEE